MENINALLAELQNVEQTEGKEVLEATTARWCA